MTVESEPLSYADNWSSLFGSGLWRCSLVPPSETCVCPRMAYRMMHWKSMSGFLYGHGVCEGDKCCFKTY